MRLFLTTAILLTTALAGCTAEGGTGSASIFVKDAPTDEFDEIHVVFTEVRIHKSGDNSTENSTSGWITLFQNASGRDIDLLAASGDKSAFLGEAELETGKYQQIRIIVTRAYGVDSEGNETNFTVSSGTIKIPGSFEVSADVETKITVDFDLDRSIKQQGNGNWRMTPVVGKTVVETVADESSGEDVAEEGEIAAE